MDSTGRGLKNVGRREVLKVGAAGLALPVVDGASANAAADPVTITLWSWLPRFQPEVDAFEKASPNIKLINAGQGLAEYVKLRNALKAGTGAPDVVQVEFYMVRSFREVHGLTDIAAYVSKYKDDYVPWAWAQVSEGNQVYALPWDSGPMGLIYRKDIFDAHQIEPPATWDAFGEVALRLRKDTPDVFLTDAMFTDRGWCTAIFWQAGWRPFDVKGDTIAIRINDDAAKKTCAFWQKLLDARPSTPVPPSLRSGTNPSIVGATLPGFPPHGDRCSSLSSPRAVPASGAPRRYRSGNRAGVSPLTGAVRLWL